MNSQCVNMPYATYGTYSSTAHYQFFCLQCVTAGSGSINYAAMMSRIAARAPDVNAMREQAESEQQLLVLYNVTLPDVCPPTSDNVCVHQSSVQLLGDHCSWLAKQYIPASVTGDGNCLFRAVSLALYLGRVPTAVESHGNATKSSGEYVRTRPQVLDAVVQQVKATKDKPRKVYKRQHLDGDGDAPRNVKQVTNAAQCVRAEFQTKSSGNLADEIQTLLTRLLSDDEDFVQGVQCLLRRSPSVVLFTQEQINDMPMFCCSAASGNMRSVLAVDRTFNLSSLFVTVTVLGIARS